MILSPLNSKFDTVSSEKQKKPTSNRMALSKAFLENVPFLDAPRISIRGCVRPSVRWSVGPLVRWSVGPSVRRSVGPSRFRKKVENGENRLK